MSDVYKPLPAASSVYHYAAYGIRIRSDAPLPLPPANGMGLLELEIHIQDGTIDPSLRERISFEQNPSTAFDLGTLSDGSNYVGWRGIGEILVSPNGRLLSGYRDGESGSDSFNIYLLTQALSFALVKSGLEPLHATAVAIEGKAVVFLGDCGFGKSTLAAACLQAGHQLLTDDLLLLDKTHAAPLACPGPPRIKLFLQMARQFLGQPVIGVPMNPHTHKLIIPLKQSQVCNHVLPIGATYALAPPSDLEGTHVLITPMTRREAFLTLLASTFNRAILDSARLRRQFEMAQALAGVLPVKRLSYPRSFDYLPAVLHAIVSDLSPENDEVACGV